MTLTTAWDTFLNPTCAVGSLVGSLAFEAFVLPLGQCRQFGGDLLLYGRRLVNLVGGADQLDGQLGLGRQRAHALLARWNLWRRFGNIGGIGQIVKLRRRRQTTAAVRYAAPERLVAPGLRREEKVTSESIVKVVFLL